MPPISRSPLTLLFLPLLLAALIGLLGWVSASEAALGVASLKWPRSRLTVCFASARDLDLHAGMRERLKGMRKSHRQMPGLFARRPGLSDFTSDERETVRNAITREYTEDRTGLSFRGWGECAQSPSADVWVFAADGGPAGCASVGIGGTSGPGRAATSRASGTPVILSPYLAPEFPAPAFVYLVTDRTARERSQISDPLTLETLAVHEFGHVAGLVHEHERDEAESDPACARAGVSRDRLVTSNATPFSHYDPRSIMNYCHTFSILRVPGYLPAGASPGLDENDRRALRCLYAPELRDPLCPPLDQHVAP